MSHWFDLILFAEALLLSFLFTPLMMRISRRLNIVDHPGERKIHLVPKSLLGGVAIVTGIYAVILGNLGGFFLLARSGWLGSRIPSLLSYRPLFQAALPRLGVILGGGILIHWLGVADDIWKEKLNYKVKFLVQFGVALFVAICGVHVEFMPGRVLEVLFTVLWIVGMTNSFNLLDNMDGLAGGVSFLCAGLLFVVALLQGQTFFAFLLAAMAGACLGFLFFNFHPSKIFMGDSGSLFLGYMFGVLTVTGSYVLETSATLIPIVMPVIILSIPLYDTFSVIFIRWREKRPLFIGDKKHFSHRLVELGMTVPEAVIFIYLVCLCVGITALLLPTLSSVSSIVVLVQAVIVYTLITILIAYGKQNKSGSR